MAKSLYDKITSNDNSTTPNILNGIISKLPKHNQQNGYPRTGVTERYNVSRLLTTAASSATKMDRGDAEGTGLASILENSDIGVSKSSTVSTASQTISPSEASLQIHKHLISNNSLPSSDKISPTSPSSLSDHVFSNNSNNAVTTPESVLRTVKNAVEDISNNITATLSSSQSQNHSWSSTMYNNSDNTDAAFNAINFTTINTNNNTIYNTTSSTMSTTTSAIPGYVDFHFQDFNNYYPYDNISGWNGTILYPGNATSNSSGGPWGWDGSLRLWPIVLVLFPLFTIFGNILVVLSVYKERSLRTVTNYFIVSLALADVLVALLVMPLAVYVEVSVVV